MCTPWACINISCACILVVVRGRWLACWFAFFFFFNMFGTKCFLFVVFIFLAELIKIRFFLFFNSYISWLLKLVFFTELDIFFLLPHLQKWLHKMWRNLQVKHSVLSKQLFPFHSCTKLRPGSPMSRVIFTLKASPRFPNKQGDI